MVLPKNELIKRKMALFGHACRNNKCNLVKVCILGMMLGKSRRVTVDGTVWRERSYAAGGANVRTDAAD